MSVNKVQTDGTLSPIATRGQFIQYSAMPTANADRVNQIIQYIGDTTTDYTNGYFYKCVLNGSSYEWDSIDVQFNDDDNKLSYADNSILGAKNLLENTANNKSSGNVDFTVNADKTITVNTTSTVSAVQTLVIGEVKGLQGNYILNGVTGGSQSTYGIQLYDVTTSTWITQYATDGDSIISLADDTHTYRFVLYVRNDATVSGIVVKPMLRLTSDTDSTYVPYAETNYQLTKNKVDWESNSTLGAKNFIKVTKPTQTFNGITFTVNSDSTVTVSTEATGATANTYFLLDDQFKISSGNYILNGCPSEGSWGSSALKYAIKFRRNPTGGYDVNEIGNGLNIAITDSMANDYYQIYICVGSGQILNNLTFKPMLRLATDTDSTYQPYSMTNQQITNLLNW